MNKSSEGNIFLFPNLLDRYMDMATEEREREEFSKAKEHLEQALSLDEHYAPAMVMLIVTYFDLGRNKDARDLAENMLTDGLGDVSEVLQLYVVSLIRLEEYGRVCELLSAVLQKKTLSPYMQKEFEEIFYTCSLLAETTGEEAVESMLRDKVEEKLEENEDFLGNLITLLDEGDFDKQLQAIEQLKYVKDPRGIKALRNFVILPQGDPMLKTFALRALRLLGEQGAILVYKFDQLVETSLEEVPGDEDGLHESHKKVIELLSKQCYHDDPVFVTFAMQIWMEYLFATFPVTPPIQHTESWAAGLHAAVANLLEQNISHEEIAFKYGTTVKALNKRLQCLQQVLNLPGYAYQSQHLPKGTE